MEFCSLWLDVQRAAWPQLQSDFACDTAIIGAGISGIGTLYFLLTTTNLSVALFERRFVASGATGHSAGLPTVYIERPISELIDEFGVDPVAELYADMKSAQGDLYKIHEEIGLLENLIPIPPINIGFNSLPAFLGWLEKDQLDLQVGREPWTYLLLDREEFLGSVPETYREQVRFVPQEEILAALNTKDTDYVAVALSTGPRMRINPALLCDRVLQHLAKKFPTRCFIFENTEITNISLGEEKQVLHHAFGKVAANDLILCTNAYTDFSLFDARTKQSVAKLHEAVFPRDGYLAAYTSPASEAYISLFLNAEMGSAAPYWYLSTAPLKRGDPQLVSCLGGPEYTLAPSERSGSNTDESREMMEKFCEKTFHESFSPSYFWHGTMGYTRNGLRWVGEDPDHPHLWYNLGCNGIGILNAIAGAQRIAKQMNGQVLEPALFDPPSSH